MSQYHRSVDKKVSRGTGGRRRGKQRDKKLAQYGRDFTATRIADAEERKKIRVRGSNAKIKLKKTQYVNVVTEKGSKKAKIIAVLESQNPEYVRRNIITKGAVLNTEIGKVKVTNRVGQDGMVNGILVKGKESS
ncbi:MAG: 30S ribosomal protein S8e [Candidatus ainarchaeum sp.]|nr:30S ribosomal protein S8e [Candidatus ainarchaeum sp.]